MCPTCAAFEAEVKRQRAALALLLPVIPSVALKHSVLTAAWPARRGAAAARDRGLRRARPPLVPSPLGGGASGLTVKALAVVALAVGAGGDGVVAVRELDRRAGMRRFTAPAPHDDRDVPAAECDGRGSGGAPLRRVARTRRDGRRRPRSATIAVAGGERVARTATRRGLRRTATFCTPHQGSKSPYEPAARRGASGEARAPRQGDCKAASGKARARGQAEAGKARARRQAAPDQTGAPRQAATGETGPAERRGRDARRRPSGQAGRRGQSAAPGPRVPAARGHHTWRRSSRRSRQAGGRRRQPRLRSQPSSPAGVFNRNENPCQPRAERVLAIVVIVALAADGLGGDPFSAALAVPVPPSA